MNQLTLIRDPGTNSARRRQSATGKPVMEDLAQRARRRLQSSAVYALRNISCACHDGELVLTGKVSSWYLKQLVQETVRSLDGLAIVTNAVEVTPDHDS